MASVPTPPVIEAGLRSHPRSRMSWPWLLLAAGIAVASPLGGYAWAQSLPTPAPAKAADACQKAIKKAAIGFLKARLKGFDKCSGTLLKCVEKVPAGTKRDTCLTGAQSACADALGAATGAAQPFRSAVAAKCGDSRDLLVPAGLGFEGLDCSTEFGVAITNRSTISDCLVAQHGCRGESTLGILAPRTRELMELAQVVFPATACLATHPGAGLGPADRKVGVAVEKCGSVIRKTGIAFLVNSLKTLEACADEVFTCVQTKPNDRNCLVKANGKCGASLEKLRGGVAKLSASIDKSCAEDKVAFSTVRAPEGLNLEALQGRCEGSVATRPDYETCLTGSLRSIALELLRFEVPRADELFARIACDLDTLTCGPTPLFTPTLTPTPSPTTTPSVTACINDGDCPDGVCSQGICCNQICAAPCNVCSAATGGICTPVGCGTPGECETGPGTCNPQTGACDYPVALDGTHCGGDDAGRICCNGGCCAAGADCVGGTCQAICTALGARCSEELQCCQDGSTFCADTCCHDVGDSCASNVECCTGQCRDGETCCAPPGSSCTNEGDCCTAGLGDCRLDVGGKTCRCLQPGEQCRNSEECCGQDVCVNGTCQTGTCLPPRSVCRSGFDCCTDGSTACATAGGIDFVCCRANGAACAVQADCCDGSGNCQGGRCCRPAGGSCNSNTLCCGGLTCRAGSCQPSCPLASFACGAACCGSYQHCVNNTCQCVPLQGACSPANNLCCQSEETLCPEENIFGNAKTCCRPQGGHCGSAADCCQETYDSTFMRDSCGNDGVCGGNDALCAVDADCVGGRACIGLCTGKGQGFKLCSTSSNQCPSGQFCSQLRCIDPNSK